VKKKRFPFETQRVKSKVRKKKGRIWVMQARKSVLRLRKVEKEDGLWNSANLKVKRGRKRRGTNQSIAGTLELRTSNALTFKIN